MAIEGRRSSRVLARLNVLVTSSTASHNALTAVVNRHGALILSPVAYPVDTILEVKNMATALSCNARVVWFGGPENNSLFKLGIELDQERPEFWGIEFPPLPPPAASPAPPA